MNDRLLDALDLGEDLVSDVEAKTRDRWGIRMPTGRDTPGETYRPESQSMNRDSVLTDIVFCFREDIDDYPREHGSYRGMTVTPHGR
ncbi:hypothetical protein [Haloechinothrix salitolerans]|uniref:Uncharacterized protein n=1 Tax=Haloechinothrix salitolerans TaxID=926830 RepID=A0ABW2BUP5_9PSEU